MLKKLCVIMLCLAVLFALFACTVNEETSMYIEEGSLPTSFSVDDAFPSNAKVSVVSSAGIKSYTITPDMVEGFDTSLSTYGEEKTMVIKRNALSVEYKYTVTGDVNTRARVEAKVESADNGITVTLAIKGLAEDNGMLAMQLTATPNLTTATLTGAISLVEGYKAVTQQDGNKLGIVYYTEDADNVLKTDGDIIKLTYQKSHTNDIMLTISGNNGYIEMTQGEGIKRMPTLTIMI